MSDTFEEWVEDGVQLVEEHASPWQGWVLVALTALIALGAPERMSELLAVTIVTMLAGSIALIIVPNRSRCPACDAVVAHNAVHCGACGEDLGCEHDDLHDSVEYCPRCGDNVGGRLNQDYWCPVCDRDRETGGKAAVCDGCRGKDGEDR
ncbi:hypothetical protein [Halostella salina]|uniref:hypothetical protein n=1 Tax=Halostella salina TaxID=1547897 RepID=UPI000EF84055|nr:hypothetical protein [Halostella salina]